MQIIEGKPRRDGAPASRHLIVAHQDSDTLAVYQLDVDSGMVRSDLSYPFAKACRRRRIVFIAEGFMLVCGASGQIVGDGPVSTAAVPSAGNVCSFALDV